MVNDGLQSEELALARTLKRLAEEESASLERLFRLLAISSISTDPAHHDSCLAAAEWCAASLSEIGFSARVEPTLGKPMVVGHWRAQQKGEARRHVLFYGHYDVQPADPLEEWDTPPFLRVLSRTRVTA
jgi:acetylornithine deacetylase/succinyl-diaminopimelate desuccinylase-like protein